MQESRGLAHAECTPCGPTLLPRVLEGRITKWALLAMSLSTSHGKEQNIHRPCKQTNKQTIALNKRTWPWLKHELLLVDTYCLPKVEYLHTRLMWHRQREWGTIVYHAPMRQYYIRHINSAKGTRSLSAYTVLPVWEATRRTHTCRPAYLKPLRDLGDFFLISA